MDLATFPWLTTVTLLPLAACVAIPFLPDDNGKTVRWYSLAVGLIDIDNFKKLNDTLGHAAGDVALQKLAAQVREQLRPRDTVARFGGEEFVVLLPETTLEAGRIAIERLQRELTKQFFLANNERLLITFSAGVVQLRRGESEAEVVRRADQAMYRAKAAGKNRVVAQD